MIAASALSGCQMTREVPPKHDDEMINLKEQSKTQCADSDEECNPKIDIMDVELKSFENELRGMNTEVEQQDDVLLLTLDAELSFNVDSVELGYEAKPLLRSIAKVMEEHRNLKVKITGHADGSGDDQHNIELSEKRAKEVSRFIGNHNISFSRIKVAAMGDTDPICENDSIEGKACNRRVELEFYK